MQMFNFESRQTFKFNLNLLLTWNLQSADCLDKANLKIILSDDFFDLQCFQELRERDSNTLFCYLNHFNLCYHFLHLHLIFFLYSSVSCSLLFVDANAFAVAFENLNLLPSLCLIVSLKPKKAFFCLHLCVSSFYPLNSQIELHFFAKLVLTFDQIRDAIMQLFLSTLIGQFKHAYHKSVDVLLFFLPLLKKKNYLKVFLQSFFMILI